MKVYNGYLITKKMSLAQLQQFNLRLKKRIEAKKSKLILDMFTKKTVEELDLRTLGLIQPDEKDESRSILSLIYDRIQNIERKNERNPEVDFSVEVCYIPFKNKLLALFYSEQQVFEKIWNKTPSVKDYHYQNSIERPKDISAKEWNQRCQDWSNATLSGSPAHVGFSFKISDLRISYGRYPKVEEVLANFPSFDQRVLNSTKSLFRNRYMKKESESKAFDAIDYTRLIFQFEDYLKTDSGKAEFEVIKQEVASKLTINFVENDLL
jgi:hypothetical protein